MLSALFGTRASAGGQGQKGQRAAANGKDDSSSAVDNAETLAGVIARQKRRRKLCMEHAAKAEHRRNVLLQEAETAVQPADVAALNEKARAAENVRKNMTAQVISLQAQLAVLDRVMTEFGFREHNIDEDSELADIRMTREEEELKEEQENVRIQQENAEEMSRILSQNITVPIDEVEEEELHRQIDEFQSGRGS